MSIEIEVKFRMNRDTWLEIKEAYGAEIALHHIERQTNQYYDTLDRKLGAALIGLRLRLLEDKTKLTIKRDTKDEHIRQEVEETYPGLLETLPVESPALQDLQAEVGIAYDDIAPLVMMRTERSIYLLQEESLQAEVCFDDVTIAGTGQEHKLYEVEFELMEGNEERLLQVVQAFQNKYGDRVERSAIPKLVYALNLVACDGQPD